jgi:hypothetical protein
MVLNFTATHCRASVNTRKLVDESTYQQFVTKLIAAFSSLGHDRIMQQRSIINATPKDEENRFP